MTRVDRTHTIRLLTTGGTIATVVDPNTGRSRPSLSGRDLASLLFDGADVDVRELDQRPSWSLTLQDMRDLAIAIQAEGLQPGCAGLVVTIGTSALEYASFVTDLFATIEAPIVFTGAMRKADEPTPDGPGNLESAFAVARSNESWHRGVLVCFQQRIMSARGVWKAHREDNDAFLDTFGDLGVVAGQQVEYFRTGPRTPPLAGEIDNSVEMIKVFPGAPGVLLDAVGSRRARGLVIEGTPGAGGLPPTMLDALKRLVDDGVLVVMSSRAPRGRVPDPPTGGTGAPLAGLPLLSAGDLTTEKAWILLSAVLGQCREMAEARQLFAAIAQAAA